MVSNPAFKTVEPLELGPCEIPFYAPGDGRLAANLEGQAAQLAGEKELRAAFHDQGYCLVRMHSEVDEELGHGLIQDSDQAIRVFSRVPKDKPIIAFFTQWAFNDRTVPLLWERNGPILVVSNFSGQDPGLVGAIGGKACLAMHNYKPPQKGHSFLWSSEGFKDSEAKDWIREWLGDGRIDHSELLRYKRGFRTADYRQEYGPAIELGRRLAQNFRDSPRSAGAYDMGCMGMLNAALDERDLEGTGVRLRRLNQVELLDRMNQIPASRARDCMNWLISKGFRLKTGPNKDTDITQKTKVQSGQMYDAVVKWSDELGLDSSTIAFQPGMNPVSTSSDVVEAMCNSTIRPKVLNARGLVIREGRTCRLDNEADIGMLLSNLYHESIAQAVAHDEGVAKLASRLDEVAAHTALKDPKWWGATGHDVRWGDMSECRDGSATYVNKEPISNLEAFIWALNLSGNMPVEHTIEAWTNSKKPWSGFEATRHHPKYFPEGGICTKGLARPGEMVWSRVYKLGDELCMDIGRGAAVNLSPDETDRIWGSVSDNWPLNEAILYGVSRDALMAGHMSNHISVSYAPNAVMGNILMVATAAMADELGYKVKICGDHKIEDSVEYKVANGLPVHGPYVRSAA